MGRARVHAARAAWRCTARWSRRSQRIAHEKFTSAELGDVLEAAAREVESLPPDSESAAARQGDRARLRARRRASRASTSPNMRRSRRPRIRPGKRRASNRATRSFSRISRRSSPFNSDTSAFSARRASLRCARSRPTSRAFSPPRFRRCSTCFARDRSSWCARSQQRPQRRRGVSDAAVLESGRCSRSRREVISAFGFDWTRGRQDKSAHPFAIPIGSDDVRITTRFDERHPFEMLFSSDARGGTCAVRAGCQPGWNRTLVRGGASLGVHESQSRLWENLIGRSLPFWQHFFPRCSSGFPRSSAA